MARATLLPEWSTVTQPVIGMLHLAALPGAPRYRGSTAEIRDALLRDADALASGGVDGLMMENFGDMPFYPGRVPAGVVAQMATMAGLVRERFPSLPLGINVLRNDGLSALAIAHATGATFIRVNVLCGGRLADQGILQAIAHDLLRERASLRSDVKILADVDVKHSAALADRPLEDEVDDMLNRGLADAVIVSGAGTGKVTDPKHVQRVKSAAGATPVLIGSGVSINTVGLFRDAADGYIVGTAFKSDSDPSKPVDRELVRTFMNRLKGR